MCHNALDSILRKVTVVAGLLILGSPGAFAQVFLQADGVTSPYTQLHAKGWYEEEETILHPGVQHITQVWDADLRKNVFVFTMHKDIDGDRGERIDRQRLEIKTYGPSPDSMKSFYGETVTNRWKFKLDTGFQPSPSFCHIHQIKAGDGPDAGMPLITITPRYGSNNSDKLQLIHSGRTGAGTSLGTVLQVALSSFKGVWVEAIERITYTETGTYNLQIRRVSDDALLMSYTNGNIDLWRTGSTFMRPKFGIYRSIGTPVPPATTGGNATTLAYLRDEQVRFADFSIAKGAGSLPDAPSGLAAISVSSQRVDLSWSETSLNADQMRIDRSSDGLAWSYLATVRPGAGSYSDVGLVNSTLYYYRIRAENTWGNSPWSSNAQVTTSVRSEGAGKMDFRLDAYPNPFNPSTTVTFAISTRSHVTIGVHDLLGRQVATLVNEDRSPGSYAVVWNATNVPSGTYLIRLTADGRSETRKALLLK